jgi:hypothetical protein
MKSYFCSQQERVAAAVRNGEWPDGCDAELRTHVENCPACSDVVLVAQALRQSRAATLAMPELPPAGILWWRAQIRHRNAAIQRVIQPVAVAEKIAMLIVVLATIALGAWRYQELASWFSGLSGPLSDLTQVTQLPGILTLGLGTLVILLGSAIYLIRAKE